MEARKKLGQEGQEAQEVQEVHGVEPALHTVMVILTVKLIFKYDNKSVSKNAHN